MAQTQTPAVSATVIRLPNGHANGLLLSFANGQSLTMTRDELTAEMDAEAVMHGLKQKFVDAAAIGRNPETGRSATVQDKFEAVREVFERVTRQGQWNATREGGGSGSLLFQALCAIKPDQDATAIRDWLNARTDDEKAALRKNPKIAAAIAEIQAARIKDSGIDSDELLNQIG